MTPTIIRIISMMAFLEVDDYLVPSYDLPPHEDIRPSELRDSRMYRFFRKDRTMTYTGVGMGKQKVVVHNLRLSPPYSERLYSVLVADCRKKMQTEQKRTHMKRLGKILAKFSGIEFVLENCGSGY
jgi:hypothetical protein